MRKPRFTFQGAFHHVMNRGHNKSVIFPEPADKLFFIDLIKLKSKLLKIRIFAFCVMDNHYHIILQNSSGKLSDFMKQINGIYGTYYRKKYGGVGYVFQNRYKSTLIQDERYLDTVILYTLLNPVRANIAETALDYKYSSAGEYFVYEKDSITDREFVEGIFQSREMYIELIGKRIQIEEKTTKIGKYIGEGEEVERIVEEHDRRA